MSEWHQVCSGFLTVTANPMELIPLLNVKYPFIEHNLVQPEITDRVYAPV